MIDNVEMLDEFMYACMAAGKARAELREAENRVDRLKAALIAQPAPFTNGQEQARIFEKALDEHLKADDLVDQPRKDKIVEALKRKGKRSNEEIDTAIVDELTTVGGKATRQHLMDVAKLSTERAQSIFRRLIQEGTLVEDDDDADMVHLAKLEDGEEDDE